MTAPSEKDFVTAHDIRTRDIVNDASSKMIDYVNPCPGMKGTDIVWQACSKCSGTGIITVFNHIDNGRCFGCAGVGKTGRKVSNIRAAERRRVNKNNKKWESVIENSADMALGELLKDYHDGLRRADAARKLDEACRIGNDIEEKYWPGDKLDVQASITNSYTFERQSWSGYGTETVAAIEFAIDSNGVNCVWYSSSKRAMELVKSVSKSGTLTATAKDIQLRRSEGTSRLVITRVKFV